MINDRSKHQGTAQCGLQISNGTRFRFVLAVFGFFGVVIFGYLLEAASSVGRDFNELGAMLIVPGFLASGGVLYFAVSGLYKTYRAINDPASYGGQSRRVRRTQWR